MINDQIDSIDRLALYEPGRCAASSTKIVGQRTGELIGDSH